MKAKRIFILLWISFFSVVSFSQESDKNIVKFKCMIGSEPLIGAKLYIKKSNPYDEVHTDINGFAELEIKEDTVIEIYYIGPYTTLSVKLPVDSIYLNVDKKKAECFYKNKKVRNRKLNINK